MRKTSVYSIGKMKIIVSADESEVRFSLVNATQAATAVVKSRKNLADTLREIARELEC
jgi:P pilus assembly chaperone PapD